MGVGKGLLSTKRKGKFEEMRDGRGGGMTRGEQKVIDKRKDKRVVKRVKEGWRNNKFLNKLVKS